MVGRGILCVSWRVTAAEPPLVWRYCRRCDAERAFRCAGKFRTNFQKKRIDVWLIYRCAACDQTWNCPVYERCRIGDVGQAAFEALCRNAPDMVRRFAMDAQWLARQGNRVVPCGDVHVEKSLLGRPVAKPDGIELRVAAEQPVGVRLDRLLAQQLNLPRAPVRRLAKAGGLRVDPGGSGALRRGLKGPVTVTIDLEAAAPALRPELVSAALE